MADPAASPPYYGATNQDNSAPAFTAPAGAAGAPPPPAYPQPGTAPPPAAPYTSEPPPKYEVPNEGPYAPKQPQPAGAYPAAGGYQTHQTVIVTQPMGSRFGPHPCTLQCPNCQATVTTSITYQSGGLTWLSAGLICLVGCWLGCCLIPFCVPDLQDVQHTCPNCNRHIGTYSRL